MATQSLTFMTSQPAEELLQSFETAFGVATAEQEAVHAQIAEVKKSAATAQEKVEQGNQKIARVDKKLADLLAKYASTEKEKEAARAEMWALSTAAAKLTAEVQNLEVQLEQTGQLTKEDVLNRLALLNGVSQFIDPKVPVQVTRDRVTWQTGCIYLLDKWGTPIFRMGKFKVIVDDTRGLSVTVLAAGDNNPRGNHPHPHIHASGRCCVGNALVLLHPFVKAMDFVQVITTMTEFLQHYNEGHAYCTLNAWGPNTYHNAYCQTCHGLVCTCSRCPKCGEIVPEANLRGCGYCHRCCLTAHVYNLSASTKGVHATSCFPKELFPIRQPLLQV